MRDITVTTTVYRFDELSDDAKEKALESLYDINVSGFDWWENVYYDAEQIGLKITGFDLDRGSYCEGGFMESAESVAKLIIENHGDTTETYKTAQDYLAELQIFMADPENYYDFGTDDQELMDHDDIDEEFLRSLLEDYRIMLSRGYDYLTSKDAIIETIEANAYEFTADGKLF
ncbi:MAG: hypothetical protein PHQ43_01035 [Dehalococcoidales bacterium]|nr:hypothetical protein [Dehalococcoidales bacterium]